MNYKAILENIYDEATDRDKITIGILLSSRMDAHKKKIVEQIIEKYRPEYFDDKLKK